MSSETNEAVAAILREMRDKAAEADGKLVEGAAAWFRFFADRIEAAAKRDAAIHAMTCEANERLREHLEIALDGKQGNAAAMREALEQIRNDLWDLMGTSSESARSNMACDMSRKIRAAIAAPARNCDVGTADKQVERFEAECKRHNNCSSCPVHAAWGEFKEGNPKSCQIIWGQLPFAPAEGGDHA